MLTKLGAQPAITNRRAASKGRTGPLTVHLLRVIQVASSPAEANTGEIGEPSLTVSQSCQPSPSGGPVDSHASASARWPGYRSWLP